MVYITYKNGDDWGIYGIVLPTLGKLYIYQDPPKHAGVWQNQAPRISFFFLTCMPVIISIV